MYRALIVTTGCMALLATPALPQSANRALIAQTAAIASPTTLPQALRAWGLDRSSEKFRFSKRTVSANQVEFENVVIVDVATAATQIGRLVVRQVPEASSGQPLFTITASDVRVSAGTTIESIALDGINAGSDLSRFLARALNSGDIAASDVVPDTSEIRVNRMVITGAKTNRPNGMRIGFREMTLQGVSYLGASYNMDSAVISGAFSQDGAGGLEIGRVELAKPNADSIGLIMKRNPDEASFSFERLLAASLDNLAFQDVSFRFKLSESSKDQLVTLNLTNFAIRGMRQGMLNEVGMSGLKIEGKDGEKPWQLTLGRFRLTGLNLRFLAAYSDYFQTSLRRATSSRGVPQQSAPNQSASFAETKLRDLLPGGPLDTGFTGAEMDGLQAGGLGVQFGIDQVKYSQTRNAAGIVTRAELSPSDMRVSWANAGPMASLTALIGTSEIAMGFQASSNYVPETDILTVEDYQINFVNWARMNVAFSLTGLDALYRKMSFGDLAKLTPPASPSTNPNAREASKANMKMLTDFFGDVGIHSAQMEISDTGGVDRFVRITASQGPAGRARSAQPLTTAQVKDVRMRLAEKPRADSSVKTKPAVERQLNLAIARWLESGGTMRFAIAPTQPLRVSDFKEGAGITPEKIGLQVSNVPLSTGR